MKNCTIKEMELTGWHQCTEVLDLADALNEIEERSGDKDLLLMLTRTCAGYIVWSKLK